MSVETDTMFSEVELEEISQEQTEKSKAIKSTLLKCKPYKDLVLGKEKEWEAVKQDIKNFTFDKLIEVGNEIVTRDFLAGIKYCLELIEQRGVEFDKAYTELGEE